MSLNNLNLSSLGTIGVVEETFSSYILGLSGLVAYWPFDETSGTTADNAEGTAALDGAITTATVNQAGQLGKAYLFNDDTPDYVKVLHDSSLSFTSGMTIFALANCDSLGAWDRILDKGDGDNVFELTKDDGNKVRMRAWIGTAEKDAITNSALSADTWYSFAGTYNGSEVAVYQNGVKQTDTHAATGNIDTTTADMYIGISTPGSNGAEAWSGLIQHVAVFNTALSTAQILKLTQLAGLS